MARVEITLNGRTYPLACEDGQEQRLRELGAYVDARLKEIASGAAAGSEAQLLVLTSLVLADEIFELRSAQLGARRGAPAAAPAQGPATPSEGEAVVSAVDNLAKRIEDIAARLERA
ncbi:MAG TPA: cell division protein ZapA [Azospirillaceae bacterium]|nr:cell division protein ZapA [Azospirillaceae bacterium]